MTRLSSLLVVVAALCALLIGSVSVAGQSIRVNHYPMTLIDFTPYLPPEYLAELKKLTPEEQRVWAWKQTDAMIDKGIIKRQKGWVPFSESVAAVAEDFVPGAGDVVRQTAADIQQVKVNAKELANDPTVHNLAKTVASAANVPINAQNGAKRVLKENADAALDRNNLSALKPVANMAIDAAVSSALPIPGAVTTASKVAGFVEKHTDEKDQVLVCSVNPQEAAAAAPGKSLMEISASSMVDHAVDADVEALWKAGILPQHSCHYIPAKALKARGFTIPKKPKANKKINTRKAKALAPGANAVGPNHPSARQTMQQPEVQAAMQAHAAKAFKPKFQHPALRGLGAVAKPATKQNKPARQSAAKAAKSNTAKPASKPAHKKTKPAKKPKKL